MEGSAPLTDEEGHVDPGVGIALALDKIREQAITAASSVDWRDRPFPRLDTTFMIFLWPEEWALCYVLSLAWMDQGEMRSMPLSEQFRAVISRLQQQYLYDFKGVKHAEDGELYARVRYPVSANNILWMMMLHGGSPPDYELHLIDSIDFCHGDERLGSLVGLLDETLARVRVALEKTPRPTKKEKKQIRARLKFEEQAAAALRDRIMNAEAN